MIREAFNFFARSDIIIVREQCGLFGVDRRKVAFSSPATRDPLGKGLESLTTNFEPRDQGFPRRSDDTST